MATEADKQLALAYFPAFRDQDWSWWEAHVAPEFVRHDPELDFEVRGPAGVAKLGEVLHGAFSDIEFPIVQVVAEGEIHRADRHDGHRRKHGYSDRKPMHRSLLIASSLNLALLDIQADLCKSTGWWMEQPMGIAERKGRERADREQSIVSAARQIASADGWSAVTIRRLAEEIEYSQPVIYSHFENRDAIVAAVAVEGFEEIAVGLRKAAHGSTDDRDAIRKVALAYLGFAREHPALYEAMFSMPTGLRFADSETRSELKDAFAALAAVVPASGSERELATETLWATLHGLADLERSGRIRRHARDERVSLVVAELLRH